ncbi:MAG: hypothetical protein ABH848_01455 [Candidatus Omnitrophota bacterium]
MTSKDIKKIINKMWPKAKKELEKGIEETRKFIDNGERHVIDATEIGIKNVKIMAAHVKKEKLFYEIGKSVSKLSPKKWNTSKSILKGIEEIKKLNREIISLQGETKKSKKK